MHCSELLQHIDDRIDDQLNEGLRIAMNGHLEHCVSCRDRLREAETLHELLSDMPVPESSAGFAARALRQAAAAHSAEASPRRRMMFASGAAAMLVAGVVLWFVTGIHNPQGEAVVAPQPQLAEVKLQLQEIRHIKLAFNAPTDMQRVRVSLEFPEHVELAEYPGRKQIAWYTNLYKGNNVLKLPLSALKTSKGKFIARVTSEQASSELQINLDVEAPGVTTIDGLLAA